MTPWQQMDSVEHIIHWIRAHFSEGIKGPLRELYRWLPPTWRRTSEFRRWVSKLEQGERRTLAEVKHDQLEALRAMIHHAKAYVPAWREAWRHQSLDESSLRTLADLERFPFMTKDALRQDAERFKADCFLPKATELVYSGGTTGAPTGFFHLRGANDDIFEACKVATWKRVGYRWRTSRALDLTSAFTGEALHVVPSHAMQYLSISALDKSRVQEYVQQVISYKPDFIMGFPSSTTMLARLLVDQKKEVRAKAVIVASEVLYPEQRSVLEQVFDARIFQWYGMSEYAGFAAACESSDAYHFLPDIGIVELIDENDRPVTEIGREGEIVLTGLTTWATPFIRYRTGDRGVLGPAVCPSCGRAQSQLSQILGRKQDCLIASNGRRIPNSALNMHNDLFRDVWAYQFVQEIPGVVRLDLVPKEGFNDQSATLIRAALVEKLGDGLSLTIERVRELRRTARGKTPMIDQRVARPEAA